MQQILEHLFRRLMTQFCNAIDNRALIQKAAVIVLQCHRNQSTYSEGCCRSFAMPQILQSTYSKGCCCSFAMPQILEHVFRRLLLQFCHAINTRALIQKAVVLQCHGYKNTYSEGICSSFVMPGILEHLFRRLMPQFYSAMDTRAGVRIGQRWAQAFFLVTLQTLSSSDSTNSEG